VILFEMPEDTLEPSHPARVLWDVVGTLNLAAFLAGAKAVVGVAGRATLSPRMKLTLWLYAISQGVGSAREIARLTVTDAAYRWAAARDFQRRVQEAITTVAELQKSRRDDRPARASTTDPEARVMKMADGGFRPAYNVRMATAGSEMGGPRTIVGVQVTNVGSDMGSIRPMLDEIEERAGALPGALLADANHAAHDCIRDATRRGVKAIVAVPERSKDQGPNAATDTAVAEWRNRMQSEQGQELYRARAGLCELMNAHLRSHGVNARVRSWSAASAR